MTTMTTTPTPSQETIDQFVTFCHGHLAGVQEMLAADPTLINTRSSLDETCQVSSWPRRSTTLRSTCQSFLRLE
ncbi:MAG TPA: hypothetical protein VFV93_15910 [Thermomicrobiales bacterium]|nr:hypothetical protein [Thermomicrobiales bacterium]